MRISAAVLDAMVAHARLEAPCECCGLLVGDGSTIGESVRTRNLRRSETAYLVDPEDHFALLKRTRREGRAIVGAYHSHPRSPAAPSATDLAEAYYRDFVYVIVSLAPPEPVVRAYQLGDGNFVPVALVPVP